MARVFIDGFETGDTALWDYKSANVTVVAAAGYGMSSAKCVKLDGGGNYLGYTLPAADSYYFAGKIRMDTTAGNRVLTFKNGSTILGRLAVSAGKISFYRGDYSANMATGTATLNGGTPAHLQIYYLPKTDGTGRCVVKLNGVTDIDFTGQTANNALQLTMFQLEGDAATYWDDIVIDSADWPGLTHVQAIFPTGAGSSAAWTPSTGSNWDCVNEVPGSDSDYVATNTANAVDSYAMGDLTGSIGSIKTVQVVARALYAGAPTPTGIKGVVRSGGTDYPSTATATPGTAVKTFGFLWETDPNTSAAWTESGVNAIEAGVKAV